MTIDIPALRALRASGTSGEWAWDASDSSIVPAKPSRLWATIVTGEPTHEGNHGLLIDPADAVLIVAAVNALLGLLDRVELLESKNAALAAIMRNLSRALKSQAAVIDETVADTIRRIVEDEREPDS